MKTLLVPQEDIEQIEQARKALHDLISNIENEIIKPKDVYIYSINITQPLYRLTHRRYKETLMSRIKGMLAA
jgi:hypothetical protein